MKKWLFPLLCLLLFRVAAQTGYQPTSENLAARSRFQDYKYGMFIHWGLSSVFGDGEWVMHQRKIRVEDYKKYINVFNPIAFNAEQWVTTAKAAGMQYIVFITRHHDGFSNWDTRHSNWNIAQTPYAKDALKQLAAACQKLKMPLGLYYSTLDWSRDDYPHQTGRTGQYAGRTQPGNYHSYLQFMKNQLTELLTQYGPITSIWLDGHWDQTNPEGNPDRSSRINWRYEEIYGLIHSLQPACLIGNNHHLDPIAGEDFQMFERDLPGENHAGLSFQKPTNALPLETCETINGSWGFKITDRSFKSSTQIIHFLVGAAGRNANLLLNVGPHPNGTIQPEFTDTLAKVGKWLAQYGSSIYGTRGNVMAPQPWGVATQKGKTIYLHLVQKPTENYLLLPAFHRPIAGIATMDDKTPLPWTMETEGLKVEHRYKEGSIDHVIVVTLQ